MSGVGLNLIKRLGTEKLLMIWRLLIIKLAEFCCLTLFKLDNWPLQGTCASANCLAALAGRDT